MSIGFVESYGHNFRTQSWPPFNQTHTCEVCKCESDGIPTNVIFLTELHLGWQIRIEGIITVGDATSQIICEPYPACVFHIRPSQINYLFMVLMLPLFTPITQ